MGRTVQSGPSFKTLPLNGQSLTPVSSIAMTLPARDTPLEMRPVNQLVVIGSNVTSISEPLSTRWQCTSVMGDKSPPQRLLRLDLEVGIGGQVVESLGQDLLLPVDMEHYSGFRNKDLVLKLKWRNIVVSTFSFFHPSLLFFA